MAEDMDVDMTFSDVMDVDISMTDADISKLLNGTHVISPALIPTKKSNVCVDSDVLLAKTTENQLNCTFNLDDNHVNNQEQTVNGNGPSRALNITVEVTKNNLNATYVGSAENNTDVRNGNADIANNFNETFELKQNETFEIPNNATFDLPSNSTFAVSNSTFEVPKNETFEVPKNETFEVSKNETFEVPKIETFEGPTNETVKVPKNVIEAPNNTTFELPNDNLSLSLTNVSDISKGSDYSSVNVTVIDMQDRTLEANTSSRSLNVTREGEKKLTDEVVVVNATQVVVPEMGCSVGKEKVCNLLNLTGEFEKHLSGTADGRVVEVAQPEEEPEVFVDALPPEEEIRQMLDGRRVSLTRHSEEITLADQVPDMFDEHEGEGGSANQEVKIDNIERLLVEDGSGQSSGHSSGNYHDVEQELDGTTTVDDNVNIMSKSTENTGQGREPTEIQVNLKQRIENISEPEANEVENCLQKEAIPQDVVGPSENDTPQIEVPSVKVGFSPLKIELNSVNVNRECKSPITLENLNSSESTNSEKSIYLDATITETDCFEENKDQQTQAINNKVKQNSLLKHTLTACHDETLRKSPSMDDSIQLMLDQSVMLPLENQFNSTMNVPAMSMPSTPKLSHLLDATLGEVTTPRSLLRQQEQLVSQQHAMLQSIYRKTDKVAKDDGMLLGPTVANAIQNKENIVASRPRTSLLLQFDPLANINNSPKKEPSPVRLSKCEVSPKVVGRLVDVEDVEHKRMMDAANEEKMHLMQEVNRLKLELNQVRQTEKDEKMTLAQEVNRLKLEMNQVQQENTTLTLEIQKKEEVYLKAEANAQSQVDSCKQEIKRLLDQLESAKETNNNEELLTNMEQELKQREVENTKYIDEIAHYKKIMNEYESTLSAKNCENERLKTEQTTVSQHLATLELSFSDTITKYDRCKEVIAGYSRNVEALQERLEKSNQSAKKYVERYETLKSHANSQLDKANQDLQVAKETHKAETAKLNTMIKRMEINNASLQHSLEQKTAECKALAQLCDEMTGSAPIN